MQPAGEPSAASLGSPLADAILAGSAPRPVRLAAAKGALPVDRPVLFRLLVALCSDEDEEIRAAAEKSAEEWPRPELEAMATNAGTDPAILAHLLRSRESDGAILAAVLSNASTPVATLEEVAGSFSAQGLDTLLLNQTLLIAHPSLLGHVEANPRASALQKARCAEVRHHFLTEHKRPAVPDAPEPGAPRASDPPAARAGPAAPPPEAPADPRTGVAPAPRGPKTDVEAEEDAKQAGVYERILKMNVTQKITLANKGSKEERSILIRDSNRSVQEAVISSPKLTLQEVEGIAKMRNVEEEILRRIARKRDWMKSYAVVHGLANNSKTPLGVSMSLLQRLTTKDLKMMTKDKNVPETLRRLARKHLETRAKQPGG